MEKHHNLSGLIKIIPDNVIALCNWDGLQKREPLKEIFLFKKVLFGKKQELFKMTKYPNNIIYFRCVDTKIRFVRGI